MPNKPFQIILHKQSKPNIIHSKTEQPQTLPTEHIYRKRASHMLKITRNFFFFSCAHNGSIASAEVTRLKFVVSWGKPFGGAFDKNSDISCSNELYFPIWSQFILPPRSFKLVHQIIYVWVN